MVNINTVYQRVLYLLNKSQGGGNLNRGMFNQFANMANLGLMNKDYVLFQNTQKMTDRMKSFIHKNRYSTNMAGQFSYPSDYFYFVTLSTFKADVVASQMVACNNNPVNINWNAIPLVPVKILDNDKLYYRNLSPIYTPNIESPVATFFDDFIQVYPINLGYVQLDYLQRPKPVFWASTEVDELPVYDPINSIDFEWDETTENSIVLFILELAGVNIREYDLLKVSEGMEGEGI